MRLGQRIVDGIFLERPNRYLAKVVIDGAEVFAHVPDPGRLPGLMIPGRKARLIHNPGPKRKTDYTLALIRHEDIWVSVYPVFANALVKDALEKRALPFLSGYEKFFSEVKQGKSRFDFMLEFANGPAYVEVKSVSLVENTVGKFPDAPTLRGVKHLRELIELKKEGIRTAVLFVSQRSDTRSIVPNDAIDPEFGKWLRKAHRQGVELCGCNCKLTDSSVSLDQEIEIILPS